MKKTVLLMLLSVLSLVFAVFLLASTQVDKNNCSYKGKRLYGKVKIVDHFPDITVKVVNSFPDLKVKVVKSFANRCGEWEYVDSFPDFTIKFVKSFPNVKIKIVNSFPGVP